MSIEQRVKQLVKYLQSQTNVYQQEIADNIGIAGATLSDIANGRKSAGIKVVVGLLEAYPDISAEWLLRGEGEMTRKGDARTAQANDPRIEYLRLYNMPDLVAKVIELEEKVQDMTILYAQVKKEKE